MAHMPNFYETIWTPTMELRFVKRPRRDGNGTLTFLQQRFMRVVTAYIGAAERTEYEWRDVRVHDETTFNDSDGGTPD